MGVGISTGAVHSILVDELKVSKICSRVDPAFPYKGPKGPSGNMCQKNAL